jgi:hypothetical protein
MIKTIFVNAMADSIMFVVMGFLNAILFMLECIFITRLIIKRWKARLNGTM